MFQKKYISCGSRSGKECHHQKKILNDQFQNYVAMKFVSKILIFIIISKYSNKDVLRLLSLLKLKNGDRTDNAIQML